MVGKIKLTDSEIIKLKAVNEIEAIIEFALKETAEAMIEGEGDKKIDCGLSYLLLAGVFGTLMNGMTALFIATGMTLEQAKIRVDELVRPVGDAIDDAAEQVGKMNKTDNSFLWN